MVNYGDVLNELRDSAVPSAGAAPPSGALPTSKGPDVRSAPPKELLDKLADAHKELKTALAAELGKHLDDVLRN
jgi:hypothetical protein